MPKSMAKKIAVTLHKGGSGKTTTAVNLATALHLKGKKVLLVDLDPQADATASVGLDPYTLPTTLYDVLTNIDIEPSDAVTETPFGLSILPSHPKFKDVANGLTVAQVGTLKAILEPLEREYDVIVIDTPPDLATTSFTPACSDHGRKRCRGVGARARVALARAQGIGPTTLACI